ncbi:plasmid recombination protein [Staphylococcus equorum]|uniref:MobV family relaxase n=1 Tax=Staphylococcus equorum TaxID=246432 RepID=UPI0024083902|nr:MobV family relaxase [Staphylococcus equorum]MDG0826459.1 plasmid recombination protein [Staphylococcus equorum]
MSYSIVRVSKVKSGTNTTGIQKHVQRENINYENEDIDHSKTHLNYDLVNNNKRNFNDLIDEKIEQNYTGKRKIRTDAVKHVDGLITSDNEFFNNQTPEDTKQFFEHAKSFLEEEYGKDNLLYATVHMDEKTPHMHYGVVPITTDGRLSAKEVVGNKKALTEFQDRFNEHVKQQGYELERGQSRQVTNAKHEQMSQYKQKTEYHKQEYERESQKLDHIRQNNDKLMQEYQKSLNTLKTPINIPYELETEKVGGLFSKETQETGNMVIHQDDFYKFDEKVKAAKTITDDYERIKSGDKLKELEKEYKQTRDNFLKTYEMYQDLKQENLGLKEENKEIQDDLDNTNNLLYHCKIAISKLLEELNRMFERTEFVDKIRGLGKDNDKVMNVMRIIDKENNPQHYQEQKQEQKQEPKRNKGMTR